MPFITKAARAATLEAAGVTEKLDALRREVTVAIQRAEDHMREDVAGLRDDMRALRTEVANDRHAILELAEGFRTDAANERRDAASDRQRMLESAASDRQAMLESAASDRQAMLDIAERYRKDSEADRRAMMALVESSKGGAA